MPAFVVTKAKGRFYKKNRNVKLNTEQQRATPQVREFFRNYADEISFAKLMLQNAQDGAELPHHLKETLLCYTNTETKEAFTPQHTYFKLGGRIYAALSRDDILGRGALASVKRVIDINNGQIHAIKLVKPNDEIFDQSDNEASAIDLSDLLPVIAVGKKKANPLKGSVEAESIFGFGYQDDTETSEAEKTATDIALAPDIILRPDLQLETFASPDKDYQLLQIADTTLEKHTEKIIHATTTKNAEETIEALTHLFLQTADALKALHEGRLSRTNQGYVHTDIKPENILIAFDASNRPTVSLGDLDSCIPLEENDLEQSITVPTIRGHGTPGYVSPESPSPENLPESISYTVLNDIYALGKTCAVILKRAEEKLQSIFPNTLPPTIQMERDLLNSLITDMCDITPERRPSLSEVKNALKKEMSFYQYLTRSPSRRSSSPSDGSNATTIAELAHFFSQPATTSTFPALKPPPMMMKEQSTLFSPSSERSAPFARAETNPPTGEDTEAENERSPTRKT